MYKSGDFVAQYIEPHDGSELDEEQIQPNGVDLRIDEILAVRGTSIISDDDYTKALRKEASRKNVDVMEEKTQEIINSDEIYLLSPDSGYVVVYNEIIEIPDSCIGFVFPRSRLLRNGCHLNTAVWDSGYKGRGEGALMVNKSLYIEADMRIGQIVFAEAESFGQYQGHAQHERIEDENKE